MNHRHGHCRAFPLVRRSSSRNIGSATWFFVENGENVIVPELGSASVGDLFPDFSAIHKKKANWFCAKITFSATFGE